MAADFFDRQDAARRNTAWLVTLFVLAVVGMIVVIDLLVASLLGYLQLDPATGQIDWGQAANPQVLALATLGTLLIIAGGSVSKIAQLRGGGHVVAEHLGGRPISADTTDAAERQLSNIVDEMAIASGIPAPPVYLLENEQGINAFAAGFTPSDAVIGVTRGTLQALTRDELQGVIGHEFSHILNGDMQLNIRLIGLLNGILIIGMLGYFILRMGAFSGYRSRRSRESGGGLPLLAFGVGLVLVGFVGTFFGNLIKASVSRQREFLADASAVQFTRNPDGIANALRKIGGFLQGSGVTHPSAPEASHMFFGRATSGLSALFATHPPLAERIRRIDPSWEGEFPEVSGETAGPISSGAEHHAAAGFSIGTPGFRVTEGAGRRAVASIGVLSETHINYAAALLAGLPETLRVAAHDPYGSRALVYALLLDKQSPARARQLRQLASTSDRGVYQETQKLFSVVSELDDRVRLPLVDIALPALRQLTETQFRQFQHDVTALVEADDTINVFEWVLQRVLLHELYLARGLKAPAEVRHRQLAAVVGDAEVLLSTLAYVGHESRAGAEQAYQLARQSLGLPGKPLRPMEDCGLEPMDRVLDRLDAASPAVKRQVLEAAAVCTAADTQVTAMELELLRAIAASLGCPMPPLLQEMLSAAPDDRGDPASPA